MGSLNLFALSELRCMPAAVGLAVRIGVGMGNPALMDVFHGFAVGPLSILDGQEAEMFIFQRSPGVAEKVRLLRLRGSRQLNRHKIYKGCSMRKLFIVLLMGIASLSSACVATRKFVRGELKTTADSLSARIDKNEGEIKENKDKVDSVSQRVTTVDGRVTDLDARTTQELNGVRSDVKTADGNALKAQGTADRAADSVVAVDHKYDQKWQNRNLFVTDSEKNIQFKFNSSQLDETYKGVLDQLAETMTQNPDAIVVLEGRTDSTGDKAYNIALAERRADTVQRYLAVEKNVPIYRIHQVSFGAAKPLADNHSREGREQNRVVTVTTLIPK
jgi:outer membrane protein OmpA-like peptidoglycan-associated protein